MMGMRSAVLWLGALSWGASSLAAEHDFDPSFGSGGQRVVPFDLSGGGQDRAVRVLRTSDGGYVLVGTASSGGGFRVAIAKLNAGGNLDTGFGSSGRADYDACMTDVTDAALDGNGRILVLGNTTACGTAGTPDGRLMRVLPSGAIDVDFGAVGYRNVRYTTVTAAHERAQALVLRGNGEILVGGGVDNDGLGTTFVENPAVLRLSAVGAELGTLPGASGSVAARIMAGARTAEDGAIWLIGRDASLASGSGSFWRMTSTLANDTAFGSLGLRSINSSGSETGCGIGDVHRPTAIVPFRGTFKAFGWMVETATDRLRSWYASVDDAPGGGGYRVRCLTQSLPVEVSIRAAAYNASASNQQLMLAGICLGSEFNQCVLRVRTVSPSAADLLELDPSFNAGQARIIEYTASVGNTPAGGGLAVLRENGGRTVVAGWRRWNSSDDDFAVSRLLGTDRLFRDGFEQP